MKVFVRSFVRSFIRSSVRSFVVGMLCCGCSPFHFPNQTPNEPQQSDSPNKSQGSRSIDIRHFHGFVAFNVMEYRRIPTGGTSRSRVVVSQSVSQQAATRRQAHKTGKRSMDSTPPTNSTPPTAHERTRTHTNEVVCRLCC